jgi:diguanylate cyclase (GGDEF)-like protein
MIKKFYDDSISRNRFDKTFSQAELKILFLVILAIAITTAALISIFNYYRNIELKQITIMRTDSIFSLLLERIPPESLINISKSNSADSTLYSSVQSDLNDVRRITSVRYLYTAKRTAEGNAIYVVDGLPDTDDDFRPYGSPIEQEILPMLNRCLDGNIVHGTEILDTSWGMIIPACEPIKQDGVTVGALAIEFDGGYFLENTAKSKRYGIIVSIGVAVAVGLMAIFLIRSFSIPLYRRLAYIDLLTGALNRNAFELAVHSLCKTVPQTELTVLTCDINKLKTINDQMGHTAGDQYIRSLAQLLLEKFKNHGETYRIGGDEFVTLLHGLPPEQVEKSMHDLCTQALAITFGEFSLSFSYGIAAFDKNTDACINDTISRADASMYTQKYGRRSTDAPNLGNQQQTARLP